jgi:pectate lyase
MNITMADCKTRKPILSTSGDTGCIVSQNIPGTWRTSRTRFFLRSMLLVCLAGLTTGIFAQEGNGYASQNGGTTGGKGGKVVSASTGTEIYAAICGRASESEPIIVEVEGTINHGNTTKVSGSCSAAEGVLEIKEVSNITIIGVGSGAVFDQLGIHLRNSKNIILRNLTVKNVKKSGTPTSNGGDAIGMESDVSNVWVDHCTLEASGGEDEGFDALFDMKDGTKYVTLSYSILRNSGRGGLVGSGDTDKDNGPVTYHHNIYKDIESRTPLLRFATAHAYNNHYDGLAKSGMNPRIGGQIKAENNYFQNANNPLGTFYTTDMGFWDVKGNIWGQNVTWVPAADEFPAGPNPVSTTSISIPYSYTLDDAACIPQILEKTAGANKNLAVSDGICNTTNIRTGSKNLARNQSNFKGNAPSYDLTGRSVRSGQLVRVAVTTRGLVIDGLELHKIYSK